MPAPWIAIGLPSLLLGLLLLTGAYALQHLRQPFTRAVRAMQVRVSFPQPHVASAPIPRQVDGPFSALAPSVLAWQQQIFSWARAYDLSPELVAIVMQIESCGDPDAQSSAGAQGLFQVMPFHFGHAENPLDPEVNARRGLDYLAKAWGLSGGDLARTLAGYNGGLSLLDEPPSAWPDETRRYVAWGTGLWHDLHAGLDSSPTLARWLDAGGSRLCSQAASRMAAR